MHPIEDGRSRDSLIFPRESSRRDAAADPYQPDLNDDSNWIALRQILKKPHEFILIEPEISP
jgi:hypothetical protein